jgi:hypothetical protein
MIGKVRLGMLEGYFLNKQTNIFSKEQANKYFRPSIHLTDWSSFKIWFFRKNAYSKECKN